MSRILELAMNLGVTEEQYKEFKISGLKEDEYKELIKGKNGETLLSKKEAKEFKIAVDKNDEYTIVDFLKQKSTRESEDEKPNREAIKKSKKEEVKLEKIELTDEDIEYQKLLMKELGLEVELKEEEFDRATIKIKSKLYDKILYSAHVLNKDVSTVINDILENSLSSVSVNEDKVAQIRENNKKRRNGSSK